MPGLTERRLGNRFYRDWTNSMADLFEDWVRELEAADIPPADWVPIVADSVFPVVADEFAEWLGDCY
ncbi:hypothetical protein HOT75_gp116 [Gordonia phage Daredevil]|uniref:Uncharacterized protein n=1 Tax=Gordonia phage Daredevil TaxID=2283286 RepID=A0A345MIX2_9CAUD|nr:hypothetical protein HOT75_gp116 [Gordonia phage Daredevil]AXH70503.1 hypothetical protein SEA_DAREDEVIL_116 [Gordonia phage Daredevil]